MAPVTRYTALQTLALSAASWLSSLVSVVQSSCFESCTGLVYFCFWTN